MFKVIIYYLKDYSLDSAIILKLIDEEGLPVRKTLEEIAYMHSGYIEIAGPKERDNDRKNT